MKNKQFIISLLILLCISLYASSTIAFASELPPGFGDPFGDTTTTPPPEDDTTDTTDDTTPPPDDDTTDTTTDSSSDTFPALTIEEENDSSSTTTTTSTTSSSTTNNTTNTTGGTTAASNGQASIVYIDTYPPASSDTGPEIAFLLIPAISAGIYFRKRRKKRQ